LFPETLCTLPTHTQALSYIFAKTTTFASAAGVSEGAFSEVATSGVAFSGSSAAFGSAAEAAFVLPSHVSYKVGYSFVANPSKLASSYL
jgi:hypothetical protein